MWNEGVHISHKKVSQHRPPRVCSATFDWKCEPYKTLAEKLNLDSQHLLGIFPRKITLGKSDFLGRGMPIRLHVLGGDGFVQEPEVH